MKNTRTRIASASLAVCVVLAGCTADTGGEDTNGADGATTSSSSATTAGAETSTTAAGSAIDSAEAVAKLQTSLDVLAAEMEGVADQDDLRTAWSEIETRVRDAVTQFQADADFDMSALDEQLDSFEEELDSADLGATAQDAWGELREAVQELVSSLDS